MPKAESRSRFPFSGPPILQTDLSESEANQLGCSKDADRFSLDSFINNRLSDVLKAKDVRGHASCDSSGPG